MTKSSKSHSEMNAHRGKPERCRREKWLLRGIYLWIVAAFFLVGTGLIATAMPDTAFFETISTAARYVSGWWFAPAIMLPHVLVFHYTARCVKKSIAAALCPQCRYSLLGHDSPGTCPECGEPFTHAGIRSAWESVFSESVPAWIRRQYDKLTPDSNELERMRMAGRSFRPPAEQSRRMDRDELAPLADQDPPRAQR